MFEYGKKSLNHLPSSNRSMSLTSTSWVARCRGRSAFTPNLFGHLRHAKVTLGWCRWLCFNIPIWNKESVSNILHKNLQLDWSRDWQNQGSLHIKKVCINGKPGAYTHKFWKQFKMVHPVVGASGGPSPEDFFTLRCSNSAFWRYFGLVYSNNSLFTLFRWFESAYLAFMCKFWGIFDKERSSKLHSANWSFPFMRSLPVRLNLLYDLILFFRINGCCKDN